MASVVLVSGAWHGGWAWRPVAERLRAAGHEVYAPTLPGLADGDDPSKFELADVGSFLVDYVEKKNLSDVTMVGHSWGGYPITDAAPRLAKRLKKLVYWSAFVPGKGRTLNDEVPPPYQGLFAQLAAAGDGGVALPLEVWKQAFMNDADAPLQEAIHALLVPQPYKYFTETVAPLDPGLKIPVSYILSSGDIALPPGEFGWARFAERLGVKPSSIPGSHEGLFTQPAALADAIAEQI